MAIENLPEYGVAIFSIGALVYVIRAFLNFLGNHIASSNKALIELTKVIQELKDYLMMQNGKK